MLCCFRGSKLGQVSNAHSSLCLSHSFYWMHYLHPGPLQSAFARHPTTPNHSSPPAGRREAARWLAGPSDRTAAQQAQQGQQAAWGEWCCGAAGLRLLASSPKHKKCMHMQGVASHLRACAAACRSVPQPQQLFEGGEQRLGAAMHLQQSIQASRDDRQCAPRSPPAPAAHGSCHQRIACIPE